MDNNKDYQQQDNSKTLTSTSPQSVEVSKQPINNVNTGTTKKKDYKKEATIGLVLFALIAAGTILIVAGLFTKDESNNTVIESTSQVGEETNESAKNSVAKLDEIWTGLSALENKAKDTYSSQHIADNVSEENFSLVFNLADEDKKFNGISLPADIFYSYSNYDNNVNELEFNVVEKKDAINMLNDLGLTERAFKDYENGTFGTMYSDKDISCMLYESKNPKGYVWKLTVGCVTNLRLEEYRQYANDSITAIRNKFPSAELAANQLPMLYKSVDGTVVGMSAWMTDTIKAEPISIHAVKFSGEEWKYIEKDENCASTDKSQYKGVFKNMDVCSTETWGP